MQVSLFMFYHAEEMSIVRVEIGFFGIGPSIVTYSTCLRTSCHCGPHDIEDQRVCGRCREALYRSDWQPL